MILTLCLVASSSVASATVAATPRPAPDAPSPVLRTTLSTEPDSVPAEPALWAAYVRIATVYVTDDAIEAVLDGPGLVRGELGLSRQLDPRWSIELGGAASSARRSVYQSYSLALSTLSAQASLVVREPVWWRLVGVARATASLDLGRLVLDDDRAVDASQAAAGLGGILTAGVILDIPLSDDGSWAVGVSVEGGYQLHGGFAFDALSRDVDGDTEPARIASAPVDAGGVSMSGALWRLGAALAF